MNILTEAQNVVRRAMARGLCAKPPVAEKIVWSKLKKDPEKPFRMDREKVLRLHDIGHSRDEIAHICGCSSACIAAILKEHRASKM
jgi:hypothetical protein